MQKKTEMQMGWEFAAQSVSAEIGAQRGAEYVAAVEAAIRQLEKSINEHPYRGQDIAHFQGYVQEAWHAGTFNVNAAAIGSQDVARNLGSHGKWSVDIQLDSGKAYSAKSFATGEKSGIQQALFDPEQGRAGYHGQGRLVPEDHLSAAKAEVHERIGKNIPDRPDIAEAYRETEPLLTEKISNGEGIESIPAGRKQLETMASAGKKQEFRAEDFGVALNASVNANYVLQQALKAGYTAAAVSIAMQLAPEIYSAIAYLIKHGEIDVQQVKKLGTKAISSGAEGFLRGSVSFWLFVKCEAGVLGEALKGISPTSLGSVVAIVMQTVKSSILVAIGKMTPKQMGTAFVDCVVVTGVYVVGSKLGGMIGQALGWQLPVFGYLLGSLVGTAFAVVYNFGKHKLISFCVDTGFTCFGLVEQDYEIPEEVLHSMGIDTIPVPRAEVKRAGVEYIPVSGSIDRTECETIGLTVLRRGVIGVNRIGYVTA